MSRPPLPLGTRGDIRVRRLGPKRYEARCQFRARNGVTSTPSASGESAAAAKRALREKLAKYKVTARKGKINRDTRFTDAAKIYLDNVKHQVDQRRMSPNTRRAYVSILKTVEGYLGDMRMGELEEAVDVVDETIKDINITMSYESAKKARTVISGICQLAIRRRAITSNPVRSIEPLTRGHDLTDDDDQTADNSGVPAMTEDEIQDMFGGLEEFCRQKVDETDRFGRRLGRRGAVWADLPDLAEASLATGTRLGETLALTGADVQLHTDPKTGKRFVAVHINAHLVDDAARTSAGCPAARASAPASWCACRAGRRRCGCAARPPPAKARSSRPPAVAGSTRPTATSGFGPPWTRPGSSGSPRGVWRKTVGTLMRQAGRSSEDIAEQLGNTRAVAEKHYYIAPPTMTQTGAEALRR